MPCATGWIRKRRGKCLGRAADWFLEQGYLEDAIEHRIIAGDDEGAAELLRASTPWFLERGGSGISRLGARLAPAVTHADPALCVTLAWATAIGGEFARMGRWLDAVEGRVDGGPPPGWHDLTGAWATLRAVQRLAEADVEQALACAEAAVARETDPAVPGYAMARHLLGTAYLAADRPSEAVPVLTDAWRAARALDGPPLLGLQAACSLALAQFNAGRFEQARQVCVGERTGGRRGATGVGRRRRSGDRPAAHGRGSACPAGRRCPRRAGDAATLGRAVAGVGAAVPGGGGPDELGGGRARGRGSSGRGWRQLAEARDVAGSDSIWPFVRRELDATAIRIGRMPAPVARRPGVLVEELTDRELSILRMLAGSASQREIGAALFLSINTVKGYVKSLYRKLDVGTRQDAVQRARALKLI